MPPASMSSLTSCFYFPRRAGFIFAVLLLAGGTGLNAHEPDGDLRLMVVLTRHGVRSPLLTNERLGQYSAQPWPVWPVAPGILTPHGREQMVLLGRYYRAYCLQQGVLTGRSDTDRTRIFLRADNDQRTVESARALADGLVPGIPVEVVARPPGELDPLFRPAQLLLEKPDRDLAVAALLGRMGGDPARVVQACRPAFLALQKVLYGGDGAPPSGRTALLDLPSAVLPGTGYRTVELHGPLSLALSLTDSLLLEYAEGMPMQDVGWGRLTPETLTQILQLHSVAFSLIAETNYPARVQGSSLADHLLRTIIQAARNRPDSGAFGPPENHLVVIAGHDTNLINLAGLLGLHWWLPGTQENPVVPGGALVFELRRHKDDGRSTVRAYYLGPSLGQIRTLEPLTLDSPPGRAPIFIPGCSTSGPGFEAPLDRFEAVLRQAVDPRFLPPDPS